ncbi:hypothetical protein BAE44_0016500 [Dichanthelium oligosanthes]|uniref:Uncharacterized protein n=1 Tax=Dichanthelium oligosanthes TaxID=888268 RepID=A0A1E5VBF6_9POAL|nr:hypothetical protein BAE44_0016500 [Dichanthelium oligosanthes]
MASAAKALAWVGSSLLGRLLVSPSPPLLHAELPVARLQAHVPLPSPAVDGYEAEAVERLTSIPGEISFPWASSRSASSFGVLVGSPTMHLCLAEGACSVQKPRVTASVASMPPPVPVCSPLLVAPDLNAGVDTSLDDALNVFDKIGTRYTFFPFNFTC